MRILYQPVFAMFGASAPFLAHCDVRLPSRKLGRPMSERHAGRLRTRVRPLGPVALAELDRAFRALTSRPDIASDLASYALAALRRERPELAVSMLQAITYCAGCFCSALDLGPDVQRFIIEKLSEAGES